MPTASTYPRTAPPPLTINLNNRAALFTAPRTPSTSSIPCPASSHSTSRDTSNISRKRTRGNPDGVSYTKPSTRSFVSDDSATPYAASPAPLVNSRYHIAGGLDTPSAALSSALERQAEFEFHNDVAFRRGGVRTCSQSSTSPNVSGPLSRPSNTTQPQPTNGWGKLMLRTVTGLAHLAWDFCTSVPFSGFTSGGGEKWPLGRSVGDQGVQASIWQDMDVSISRPGEGGMDEENGSPSHRAAKKVRHAYEDDGRNSGVRITEQQDDWVLVEQNLEPRPFSPSKRNFSTLPVRRTLARPTTRRTTVGPRHSSSSSLSLPASRPSSSVSMRHPSPRGSIPIVSPMRERDSVSSRRRQSRQESPLGDMEKVPRDKTQGSPLSGEAERFVRERAKREREEDRELTRMNRRLEDMIRQGKEVLGTRFEVEEWDE